MKKLIIPFLAILLFLSCETDLDPIASFKVVPENPVKGQTVQLINKSVNSYYYQWKNGNTTNQSKDWALILNTSGNYAVTLQVWNKEKSKTDSKTIIINVP